MSDNAFDRLAGLVMEDGSRWGEVAVSHQIEDAEAVLLHAPGDTRKHLITRPRYGSKTTDLAGISIAVLVDQAPSAARCYVVAADKDQARLLLDAAEGFIERTPGLGRILRVDAFRITNIASAATLEVLAADGASTWGLRPYWTIVDEIGQWPETRNHKKVWTGLVSAWPKVPEGRLVAMTSAGEPSHFSFKIREQALRLDGWRVSEMPGPVPWMTEQALADQQVELLPSEFERLVLNRWTEGEDRLTTREAVLDCVGHAGRIEPDSDTSYTIGLDLGFVNDATVLVVAHSELVDVHTPENIHDAALAGSTLEERVVVDHFVKFQGSRRRPVQLAEVEQMIRTLAAGYGKRKTRIVGDNTEALGMIQRLVDDGFRAEDWAVTPSLNDQVATNLYRLLENRQLDLPDDEYVIDQLSTVRLVRTSFGKLRIDHDSGQHDDFVQALGYAVIGTLDIKKGTPLQKPPGVVRMRSEFTAPTQQQKLDQQLRRLAERGDPVAKRVMRQQGTVRGRVADTRLRGRR